MVNVVASDEQKKQISLNYFFLLHSTFSNFIFTDLKTLGKGCYVSGIA